MPFKIIRNDITKVKADAIVDTANPEPRYASGTDAAIYRAAGADDLLAERKKIGRIAPGEAAVTAAFQLPAHYIIHTVGPAWNDGNHGEYEILRSCYRKSLLLADQLGCESIAFPLIATGIYGFPREQALEIALSVIREHLEDSDLNVILVVFERSSYQIAAGLTEQIEEYIDENYVFERSAEEYGEPSEWLSEAGRRRRLWERDLYSGSGNMNSVLSDAMPAPVMASDEPAEEEACPLVSEAAPDYAQRRSGSAAGQTGHTQKQTGSAAGQTGYVQKQTGSAAGQTGSASEQTGYAQKQTGSAAKQKKASLEDVVNNLGESFQARLLRMIDARGMTDPEVYKRANIDRKLFSKIRCSEEYIPRKKTIVALAIALRLDLDDTKDLLASAGLVLTNNSKADVIVRFCIENGIYDIFEVNALLFKFQQPILG